MIQILFQVRLNPPIFSLAESKREKKRMGEGNQNNLASTLGRKLPTIRYFSGIYYLTTND